MVTDESYWNEPLDVFAKNLKKEASDCQGNFHKESIIGNNTDKLSKYFNMTNITAHSQEVSNQSIQHGTELFLYLNACQRESVLDYWKHFYEFLFSELMSSQQKVLSLLKIMKDKTSKDGQDIANAIMVKLSKELGFKYYNPKVSRQGITGNKFFWKNNFRNITGIDKVMN